MMPTDHSLIQAFQSNLEKEAVFTKLMHRHQEKLYYQIKRMGLEHADADDVAQNVWIKVWGKLDGFKMESEFSTWLFRIGHNETINYINKQKRNGQNHAFEDGLRDYNTASSTQGPQASQIQIHLEQGIKQLPEKQKFVFMLRYFEEMDYEKIASITSTTVGGAKANYHQAVKKLQEFISNR